MSRKRAAWAESFYRESGIRRGIILHGNIVDLVVDPKTGRWLPTMDMVTSLLKERGFRHVVLWDRVAGVSGVDPEIWRHLQAFTVPAAAAVEGEAYDLGPEPAPAAAASVTGPGPVVADPLDFFAVLAHHLHQPGPEPVAFVLDWSNYLFGSVNALSETERAWLLLMGKAARDAPVSTVYQEIERPNNLMVLVCQGLANLPPALYQHNPLFKDIIIPLPSRVEREAALLQLSNVFNVEPPIQPHTRELADFTDALDGFTLRDVHQAARLSRQSPRLSPEALVNLYRYGERDSPWENLNRDKLRTTVTSLGRRVKGQDTAIAAVDQMLLRAYTGVSGLQHSRTQRMPKGVLFFVGPTGVGKTELAKALAEFLFGDEDACMRFDMSEFNHEHADQRLVGAPPGYVGYEEGGQLTNAVKQRPFSVILFDEIEKAHPRILDKFLQILEDGRLTDGKGETVSFAETVIIFTSNIGAAVVHQGDPVSVRKAFVERVRSHFVEKLERPELLGRIGANNIIPFNFVTDESFLVAIARAKLEPVRHMLLEKHGIEGLRFQDENRALRAIVATADSSTGGRGVATALADRLYSPLAHFLFEEVSGGAQARGKVLEVVQAGSLAEFDFELS